MTAQAPVSGPSQLGARVKSMPQAGSRKANTLEAGTHGLVPVVVELALDRLVQVAGVQPFLGIADPVHDLLVHFDRPSRRGPPTDWLDAVAVQAEGVGVGSEGVVALGLQLGGGGLEGVPVLDLFAHGGGVIGTEDVLRNIPPVDQKARAALPGGAALDAVLVGGGGLW